MGSVLNQTQARKKERTGFLPPSFLLSPFSSRTEQVGEVDSFPSLSLLPHFVHNAVIAPTLNFLFRETQVPTCFSLASAGRPQFVAAPRPNLIHPGGAIPSRNAKEFCYEILHLARYFHSCLLTCLSGISFLIPSVPFSDSTPISPFEDIPIVISTFKFESSRQHRYPLERPLSLLLRVPSFG